jgi:hypothetical protein
MPAYLLEGTCLKDPSDWRPDGNLARCRAWNASAVLKNLVRGPKGLFQQYPHLPEADLFQ